MADARPSEADFRQGRSRLLAAGRRPADTRLTSSNDLNGRKYDPPASEPVRIPGTPGAFVRPDQKEKRT